MFQTDCLCFGRQVGRGYEEIPAVETARRTQDPKRFLDIVKVKVLP